MKKLFLLALVPALMFSFAGCKKEESKDNGPAPLVVQEKNTPFYTKLTATWCGPCGAWGWSLNKEIVEGIGTDAISMSVYGSSTSNFQNPTSIKWMADFGGKSYPNFTMNGVNKTVFPTPTSISTAQTKADIITGAQDFSSSEVLMNAAGRLVWEGQKLTVQSVVKTFKQQEGEFYVGAYIVENNAFSIQNGQNGEVQHPNVNRGSMSSSVYGVKYDGGLGAGVQGSLPDFTYDVPQSWVKENISVALIIWKKEGDKYIYVNGHIAK